VLTSKLAKAGKTPENIPPVAGTLSAINHFKKTLSGTASDSRNHWIEIMAAYGRETTAQIATEAEARAIKQQMQDREADLGAKA
jgi:hypothetical protein